MAKVDIAGFKDKLDSIHTWPSLYMFKFIVPSGKEHEVYALFPKHELQTKTSSKGNYVSITAQVMMRSSDEVMDKYREAHKIEGVMAL